MSCTTVARPLHLCGWVTEAKNAGLRFRALLDGRQEELSLMVT